MKSPHYLRLLPLLFILTGCFHPIIPISTGPKYPIDVFYADQQPGRPYDDIKFLSISEEVPIRANQKTERRTDDEPGELHARKRRAAS